MLLLPDSCTHTLHADDLVISVPKFLCSGWRTSSLLRSSGRQNDQGKEALRQIERYSDVYLVNVLDGALITIGHRSKRLPN